MQHPRLPIVCDVAALVPDDDRHSPVALAAARARAEQVAAEVFAAAVAASELADGYLIQLRDAQGILALAAEFVDVDRRCCAFLRHSLVVDSGGGPIWLEITGDVEAKASIAADVVRLLPAWVKPC